MALLLNKVHITERRWEILTGESNARDTVKALTIKFGRLKEEAWNVAYFINMYEVEPREKLHVVESLVGKKRMKGHTLPDSQSLYGYLYYAKYGAVGPTTNKSAPLKSLSGETITDREKQMERWLEHYSELYSRENTINESALDSIDTLSVLWDLDAAPTLEEVSKAIDSLRSGKAPGMDGIPPEVIKSAKGVLLPELHDLLCQCWEEGEIPQDLKDSNIITLYKNKGDRSDCNNYRGISLLSIVGKIFARVVLGRLQRLADRVYPESQCGFRSERSTIDMIFSLRQLQEKCREQRQPLFIGFIDLTKAFDLVSRDGLFKILAKIGCPPKLLRMIQSFHTGMKGVVQFDGSSSEAFDIRSGVKQGCVLAPTLFGIFFAVMLKCAFGTSTEGVYLHTRSDGKLFNLSRLKAKTKVREVLIRDLLFADDAALAAHTENKLQILLDKLSCACQDFSLTISLKKTKVMCQGVDHPPSITINNYELEVVPKFTYLGSTVTNNLSLEAELNGRIGRAATTFARLQKRRRLRWLGHVCRMPDGRIPKDLLYSELAKGTRARGRPHLRFKDVVKRDMKDMDIDINTWETLTTSRTPWRQTVKKGLQRGEEKQRLKSEHRRLKPQYPCFDDAAPMHDYMLAYDQQPHPLSSVMMKVNLPPSTYLANAEVVMRIVTCVPLELQSQFYKTRKTIRTCL
ncbi:hypothetical protein Bbelb_051080 [Branchiostoma belcheri]|nr:hypothetical protein Bbelb_051080 [Branchiostoma belcheri]